MPNLEALLTNVELCSTITFPTLKKLSVNDVVTIWSSVSKHVRQQLLKETVGSYPTPSPHPDGFKDPGTPVPANLKVLYLGAAGTLFESVQLLSELQSSSSFPGEIKKVSVSYKEIHLDVPYSEKVVQHCVQETLNFFYFILKKKEDMDFILKDVGTLAIRGTEVTMAFSEDFLLSLNKSTDMVEKLLTKKWVISDKEVTLFPSHFGRVHQFPQFEMRVVPRRISLTDIEKFTEVESGVSSTGIRGTDGRQHKETPFKSPELPLPTSESHRQTGQKRQSVFGMNSRRKLEASMAKRKEKEENREAELPQQQAGRESDKMRRAQLPQEEEDRLRPPETTSNTEERRQTLEAWIQLRRHFRTDLESLGDVERWLTQKPFLSQQEERYLERIKAHRAGRRAAVTSPATDSPDLLPPKSSQPRKKGTVPIVCASYPQALVTLHNLLHEKRLRMVSVFKAAHIDRRKIKREDFIKVIKGTKVPISDKDLEDVVIFLTSSKPGNFISLEDLIDCQKQWLEMRKRESQETKRGVEVQFQKATCQTATFPPSAGDTAKGMKPHALTKPKRKLTHLEVPPVNTEPEQRHLSYEEMEEIGKQLRERRRWEKVRYCVCGRRTSTPACLSECGVIWGPALYLQNKDSPIEWKEKCRMVRSGDGCIDEHCLPSTVETDFGELVDQYRRKAIVSYMQSSELCEERNVHITKATLQKALLHPGDKIIKEGADIRKIRQPGGYYSTGRADGRSRGSTSRSGYASGSWDKEAEDRHLQRRKMQKTSDNKFWPGHLLDKLYLYLPEKRQDRAHALFSCVRPTRPVYHGI
ncbi:EF-hand calcium-binding domain-containing protein 12 [Pluvialis apricaria]